MQLKELEDLASKVDLIRQQWQDEAQQRGQATQILYLGSFPLTRELLLCCDKSIRKRCRSESSGELGLQACDRVTRGGENRLGVTAPDSLCFPLLVWCFEHFAIVLAPVI